MALHSPAKCCLAHPGFADVGRRADLLGDYTEGEPFIMVRECIFHILHAYLNIKRVSTEYYITLPTSPMTFAKMASGSPG